MTLQDFILTNMEKILEEWEKFARTIPETAEMNQSALRDHARGILGAIAKDMASEQTEKQREVKSKGQAEKKTNAPETDAEKHATARKEDGFSLNQLVSEFRALRSSVIRLWIHEARQQGPETLAELIRFNEGIDQALSESIAAFSARLDESRQLFLGMVGHDLRSPLGAILMSALYLSQSESLSEHQAAAVNRIENSGRRMKEMLTDLLDIARTRLGEKLPVDLQPTGLEAVCREAIAEAQAHHPDRQFAMQITGDPTVRGDRDRLGQVVANLLQNAVRYGNAEKPITITAQEEPSEVVLRVHNHGTPIDPATLKRLFRPIAGDSAQQDSYGLGLYICCLIIDAHDGSIKVTSTKDAGTTFTIRLARP